MRGALAGPDAQAASTCTSALDDGDVARALAAAGVAMDAELALLLQGYPTRYLRACYTETWVASLYQQLTASAPWRFLAAHAVWQQEFRRTKGMARGPVALFGLKGLTQARKPTVALDNSAEGPVLRMIWTGSNDGSRTPCGNARPTSTPTSSCSDRPNRRWGGSAVQGRRD